MAHSSSVNYALKTETGLAPIFPEYHGTRRLVTVGNGHTKIEIEGCPGTHHTSWNVQGSLSFDSPLLPSDPIEKVAVLNGAITDILREVAGDALQQIDFMTGIADELMIGNKERLIEP